MWIGCFCDDEHVKRILYSAGSVHGRPGKCIDFLFLHSSQFLESNIIGGFIEFPCGMIAVGCGKNDKVGIAGVYLLYTYGYGTAWSAKSVAGIHYAFDNVGFRAVNSMDGTSTPFSAYVRTQAQQEDRRLFLVGNRERSLSYHPFGGREKIGKLLCFFFSRRRLHR